MDFTPYNKMLRKRHKPQRHQGCVVGTTQRGAGDWRPYYPDRPPQFNRDIQALVPRWQAEHATGAPTNEDYYAWIQTQPEWATLKRGDISISAVQEKARQATAQSFKDDAQRATPDEIGRQRYGEAWDTYSTETKRGLAMAPVFKEVGAQVSKTNPPARRHHTRARRPDYYERAPSHLHVSHRRRCGNRKSPPEGRPKLPSPRNPLPPLCRHSPRPAKTHSRERA